MRRGISCRKKDLEWLAGLAPVCLGFLMESWNIPRGNTPANPGLAYARASLEKTGRYMTHIMTPDEKDLL